MNFPFTCLFEFFLLLHSQAAILTQALKRGYLDPDALTGGLYALHAIK